MTIPEGYKTAEEIAVDLNKSVYLISRIAKELRLRRIVFEDNRRRFSPQDVERIKEAAANRGQSAAG